MTSTRHQHTPVDNPVQNNVTVLDGQPPSRKMPVNDSSAVTTTTTAATITKLNSPRLLAAEDVEELLPSLRNLLQSCVNQDPATSSIGFLAPLSDAGADDYWRSVGRKLQEAPPTCYLFVLTRPDDGEILATVQLATIPKATQAHRGEIAKLLVSPSARRLGLGNLMMRHVEAFAGEQLGLRLLTLDTKTTTPARSFYNHTGWTEWGTCPDYAAFADGTLGSVTFFRKTL